MTLLPWWWSHLSLTMLVACLLVAGRARWSPNHRVTHWFPLVALASGMVASVLPLDDLDLAGYFLAYSGELSFSTLFFLAIYLCGPSSAGLLRVETRDWHGPRMAWAIGGLVLYATAMGGRWPDIYSMGFGPTWAWPVLAGSAGLAIAGRWLGAVLLLGILWSWQLQLSGGVNFWDYAIDPFIFVGSLTQVLGAIGARVLSLSGVKRRGERKLTVVAAEEISAPAS